MNVEQLITALSDSKNEVCWDAARVLGEIGSPAVPALITALSHSEYRVRSFAAKVLRDIGSPAADCAVLALITALRDTEYTVRSGSAAALGEIGSPAADCAVPALITALSDRHEWLREQGFLPSLRDRWPNGDERDSDESTCDCPAGGRPIFRKYQFNQKTDASRGTQPQGLVL